MSYKEFKDTVLTALQDFYSHDAKVYCKEVLKNNGVRLDGIVISFDPDERLHPNIYINRYYEKYRDEDVSIDKIVEMIIEEREKANANPELHEFASNLTEWDKISGDVYPALINSEANQELLKELVSRPFLDLSIIYVIRIPKEIQNMIAHCKITKTMLKHYGVSEEELHRKALDNLCNHDRFQVQSIYEAIGMLLKSDTSAETADIPDMLVLSSDVGCFGAAQLLNIGQLKEKYAGRSFYVIPSSVNEVILVNYNDKMDPENLNEMIREVNSTQLDEGDVLSDHVYYYDGVSDQISLCA